SLIRISLHLSQFSGRKARGGWGLRITVPCFKPRYPSGCIVLMRNVFFISLVMTAVFTGCASGADKNPFVTEKVGRTGTNRIVTPVNQVLTPYGTQIELRG